MAVLLIIVSALFPRIVLFASPLLALLSISWADKKTVKLIGDNTVLYGGIASVAICVIVIGAYTPSIRLENLHIKQAQSYVEQRLVDESYVIFYGQGAGFYTDGLVPASSFVDSRVFEHDTAELGLVDRLRGEAEASIPRFVVVPVGRLSVATNDRINTYIDKHYEKTASLDGGFEIYRRK
jgi:hypothetical protein